MMKQTMWAGLLILASLGAAGCTNTLVFAEKDGYNLAINVNDDPSTPVHVNIGLERRIAAVVPPLDVTKSDQGQTAASAEAVSLFSGYRLKYYNEQELARTPFSATLAIRTQFASGMAARKISKNPEMVAKVVDYDYVRDLAFVEKARQERVHQLLLGIDQLSDSAAIALATAPPVHDSEVDQQVAEQDPHQRRLNNAAAARAILKMEVVMTRRDDASLAAWGAAIPTVP